MNVEKQMECRLTGETEVLGENLPQRHFCPIFVFTKIRVLITKDKKKYTILPNRVNFFSPIYV
jgi:hypothetical protein